MKTTLFFAFKEINIKRFQSQKLFPSKGTETSLALAVSDGCKKYTEALCMICVDSSGHRRKKILKDREKKNQD